MRRRREVYLVNWRQLTGRACDWLPEPLTRVIRAKRRRSLFARSYARSRSVAAFFRHGRFPRLHLSETPALDRGFISATRKRTRDRYANFTIAAFGTHTLRFSFMDFDQVALEVLSRSIYPYGRSSDIIAKIISSSLI